MERVVSRSQLRSAERTPSPAPSPRDTENLKHLQSFQYVDNTASRAQAPDDQTRDDEQLDFQLFAPSKSQDGLNTARKIRLRSPTPTNADPGFIQPRRVSSYYFASISQDERLRFEAAAISASQVLSQSTMPRPGSAYPWRVLHLPLSQVSQPIRHELRKASISTTLVKPTGDDVKKRKRVGKKARIALRTKLSSTRLQQAEASKAVELKEAAERAKRAERNRLKKLKRRAREKAKKSDAACVPDG